MWPFRRRKPLPKKSDLLATQVRVKSITRPLAKAGTPPPMPTQTVPVETALQRLLRTANWSETHQVLEHEASILLTDDAQTLLRRYIREVRASGAPEAVNIAMYLEAHRLLLERARVIGIEHAWDEFVAIRPVTEKESVNAAADTEAQATMNAVHDLLDTESWGDTLEHLFLHQELLLTDSADHLLSALIQLAMQETSPEAIKNVRYLELHRSLLRDARTHGIDRAWNNFEVARTAMERDREQDRASRSNSPQPPNPAAVSEALRALLKTTTWEETRRILDQQQSLLLTDLSDLFISQLIGAAESDPDPRAARGVMYLKLHRNLLRRARSAGIPAAWEAFQRELAAAQGEHPEDERPAAIHSDTIDLTAVHRAVRELISAPSRRQERVVLDARRGVLLTDEAIRVIDDEADRMERRSTQRDVLVVRQLREQAKLLRRARELGLDRAWSEYDTERGR